MVAENTPTLAELRQKPHLSYSAIRSYLMCPMKFWHSYQNKSEPSHRPLALVLGSAIHEALAAYYAYIQDTGMKIAPEQLMDVFRDKLDFAGSDPRFLPANTGAASRSSCRMARARYFQTARSPTPAPSPSPGPMPGWRRWSRDNSGTSANSPRPSGWMRGM